MTPEIKFILDELATVKAKADLAVDSNVELLVLLREKSILSKEDIEKFKEKLKKLYEK